MECPSGKASYPNATKAARAMKKIARRTNAPPHTNLDPYHCPACGQWHLGRRRTVNPFKSCRAKNPARIPRAAR